MALINETNQAYYECNNYGNYQFVSLDTIINQFQISYVGQDKTRSNYFLKFLMSKS